tara:strand:+ start:1194 stop:1592 length:399 start_codon:yes stop_codon:yes gene_type:complete
MMDLRRISKLAAGELQVFRSQVEDEMWLDLMQATQDFFLVEDNEGLVALVAVILPDLIGSSAYLWMVKTPEALTLTQVLGALRLARSFLPSLPWDVFAECEQGNEGNTRFLIACGFEQIAELTDRNLFLRSA